MRSENGLLIDVGEVAAIIEQADVFLLGFANFNERLLVDTRNDDHTWPLIKVVPSLGSFQERILWLRKQRPGLGTPGAFSFINWPHSPSFLPESGIWERVRARVNAATDKEAAAACEAAIGNLMELERRSMVDAIGGHRYVTLWPPEADQD